MEALTDNKDQLHSMSTTRKILIVDDERSTAEFFARVLRKENYEVAVSNSFQQAVSVLKTEQFAVIVLDIQLDNMEGTTLLPIIKQFNPDSQVVFVTGHGSIDSAVNAIHHGAFDYISKPLDLMDIQEDLKRTISRALDQHEVPKREEDEHQTALVIPNARTIVGRSPEMVKIYRAIAKAALTREHVFITGESGTGKELVAHAIHKKSPWAEKPFVTVNCCALTETLLESELFGHIRGSFTGATTNKKGLFEEADGGTIFLDEIGDISLTLQVKLLRAIQEGEIKPVGASETRNVDVRVIAATHRDLLSYVREGKFREDLYYRLKVIPIEIPPLREREQDLPELISYFITKYAQKTGKNITGVSDEAMQYLLAYPWPGNIRELENAFGRATAMTNTTVLFPEDFPQEIIHHQQPGGQASQPAARSAAHAPNTVETYIHPTPTMPVNHEPVAPAEEPRESLEEVEKRHILKTLESVNFNKSKAAEILGIDRVTLYRKAFKYGLLQKRSAQQPVV
jgi:two-component system, NtrC family, response regulator AtoC